MTTSIDNPVDSERLTAKHSDVIAGLRLLADFLEDRPTLTDAMRFSLSDIGAYPLTTERWQQCLNELGTFDKRSTSIHLHAERAMNDSVMVSVTMNHEDVCERVEVGVKEVEVAVYPDDVVPTIERQQVPVYEWKCPPSWIAPVA